MDRKNLWIAGGLIVFILVIGIFVIVPAIVANSTGSNSTTNSSEDWLFFDNSTPEAMAISIARLHEGQAGFNTNVIGNASLSSDGKYWIVQLNNGTPVTVDAKIWKSKKANERWWSLDELKALYIAEIQINTANGGIGKPSKIIMDGKEIWTIPAYYYHESDPVATEYVYVDLATGKSRNELYDDTFSYYTGDKPVWLSLKEVDAIIDKIGKEWPGLGYPKSKPFKDALRNLYSE